MGYFGDPRQSFSRPPLRLKRRNFSNKESILAQWRQEEPQSWEKQNIQGIKSIQDLVESVTDKFQLEKKRNDSEVFLVWKEVIEPRIAEHAKPVGLRNGTLFVVVDSPVWLEEIVRFHRASILKSIQSAFSASEIKKISFRCSG